jgi:15-cis-phytoene synthase
MSLSRDALETSYAFCRQVSSRAGSSFYAGFLLLPKEKRRAMEAVYAFMRHTDDLADDPCSVVALTAAKQPAPDRIATLRMALQQALMATDVAAQSPPRQMPLPHHVYSYSPFLRALADTVHRFRIPHEHLLAVIDGVEMDLTPRRYETFEELERYCERVASAVGMACIHVWGFRGPEAFEPARQTGIALQLTNILRDLKEDAAAGRVYLPLADLRQCGYSPDELAAGVANDAFLRLMRFEIERAKRFYLGGAGLWEHLEPDGRRIFGLMTGTYRRLLERIERRPADVLLRRVRVGSLTRLALFARWMLFPPQTP